MDGEIAGYQRWNSPADLRGVLLVFPYPSGTGDPPGLRVPPGNNRIHPERHHRHDLSPHSKRALTRIISLESLKKIHIQAPF